MTYYNKASKQNWIRVLTSPWHEMIISIHWTMKKWNEHNHFKTSCHIFLLSCIIETNKARNCNDEHNSKLKYQGMTTSILFLSLEKYFQIRFSPISRSTTWNYIVDIFRRACNRGSNLYLKINWDKYTRVLITLCNAG